MCADIKDFQYSVSVDSIVITRYIGGSLKPAIPTRIDGLPVKELGAQSFAGTDIACITVPEGIEHIGKNAFGMCESLTDVTLPMSLNQLDCGVFQGCEHLKTIKISDGNAKYAVDDGILYDTQQSALILCPPGLNRDFVKVKPGTKIISNAAFYQNRSLTQIILPPSLVRIESSSFLFTDNLPYVSIPPSVNRIDKDAFLIGPLHMCGKRFKLLCFKDSYAYQYAAEQGIPAEALYAYITD